MRSATQAAISSNQFEPTDHYISRQDPTVMTMIEDRNVSHVELFAALAWLKQINKLDDNYLARWDITEWANWYRAMQVGSCTLNPVVPLWMQNIIGKNWSRNWSLPFPTLGQLWPTKHNWFLERQLREDFDLRIMRLDTDQPNTAPGLKQLQSAWQYVAGQPGTSPLLMIDLLPPRPSEGTIVGEISGFYAVGSQRNQYVGHELASFFKTTDQTYVSSIDEETLFAEAQINLPETPQVLYAWEWIS